jgi:tetratricopeptide (TPR) repeat protein
MRVRWLLLLLCGSVLLAQSELNRAWDLAGSGHPAEAIQILRSLVTASPQNADARLLLGNLLMEAGDQEGSLNELNAAVKLRPRSSDAENSLGEAYRKFGNNGAARAAFEKAVALKPDSGIAQLNLGQSLLVAGESVNAANHLDRAIRLLGKTDDAADAHYLRAKIDMAQNKAHEAAAQLEQAVAIRPHFAEAWSDLGQARRTLLDDAGALLAWQRAVEANPEDAIAQYRLGAEYLRQGNPPQAVAHLEKSLQLNPTDQSTLNSLQIALRQNNQGEEANRIKQKLTELLREKDQQNQNHLAAVKLNNEGATLEKSGDLGGALARYSEALRLYPEHNGIRINHAVALLRLGRWSEGLDELHEASLRDPANAEIKAALNDALKQAPRNATPSWAQNAP